MKKFLLCLVLFYYCQLNVNGDECLYILNDDCIKKLYEKSLFYFRDNRIKVLKDSRGIIIRYEFSNAVYEYNNPSFDIYNQFKDFLVKINNFAIIEVHTERIANRNVLNLANWELSTIIANNVEQYLLLHNNEIRRDKIVSVGYGEFLPAKNTSNNGGKIPNRIDIIILCDVSGE